MNTGLNGYDEILLVLVVAIAHCIILINFINSKVKAFNTDDGVFSIVWFLLVVAGYIVSAMSYIVLLQYVYHHAPYFILLIFGILFVILFLYLVYLIAFKCKFSFSVKIDKK